jgi:sugar/nucleoside kinase (ribokinase family)
LLALGPKCVLITDGKRGAFAASAGEVTYCPALAVDVVGTAGAGDGFTATFTALHASGCAPGDALQYATLNAASVVKHADTQSGLLARQTLDTEREREKHRLEYKTWRLVATSA